MQLWRKTTEILFLQLTCWFLQNGFLWLRLLCQQLDNDNAPEVLAARARPASLKAASPLIVARRIPHRNMATGSMPMSCRTYALSLLLNNATMSERMWSVFFSRKSCWGVIQYRSYNKPNRGANEIKNNLCSSSLPLLDISLYQQSVGWRRPAPWLGWEQSIYSLGAAA